VDDLSSTKDDMVGRDNAVGAAGICLTDRDEEGSVNHSNRVGSRGTGEEALHAWVLILVQHDNGAKSEALECDNQASASLHGSWLLLK
jgi:hypothetical protein